MTANALTVSDMSLGDFLVTLWKRKIFILCGIAFGLLAAFVFMTVMPKEYQAEMLVAPADGYALGDYASAVEHDRIAAMPFWRPKTNEGMSPDFHRFIHTLRGKAAAEILLKDESVLAGINDGRAKKMTRAEELSDYLQRQVRVDPMGATPLRRIHYHHHNPDFAQALLRKMHLVADQMIRRDRRKQSQSRIAYLEEMLQKTLNPDHRKGITNLLMQQEHIQMLANLDEAYAAIIVEPAHASPKPVRPNGVLSFLSFAMIGAITGYLAGFLSSIRKTAQ